MDQRSVYCMISVARRLNTSPLDIPSHPQFFEDRHGVGEEIDAKALVPYRIVPLENGNIHASLCEHDRQPEASDPATGNDDLVE